MNCTCNAERRSVVDYDRASNLQRTSVTCLRCGDVEERVEAGGDRCYPQNAYDMLDLGLDPYIIEAFGGVGVLRGSIDNRRAAPARHDASRAAAPQRPTEDDEKWRRERSDMLARLSNGDFT